MWNKLDRVVDFSLSVLLVLCITGLALLFSKPEVSKYQPLLDATVKVINGSGHGSGVLIKNSLVITNRHVVEGLDVTDIIFNDGSSVVGSVVLSSKGPLDFAIIRIDPVGVEPVPIRCSVPIVGEEISIVGNPLKASNVLLKGIISSGELSNTEEAPNSDVYTIVQAPVNPGNSGGGTFDRKGRLLGITTAYLVAPSFWIATNSGLGLMQPLYKFCDALGLG